MPIQVIDRIEPQGGDQASFKVAYAKHIGLTYTPEHEDDKLANIRDVDTAIQRIDKFISDTTLNLEILNISKVEGSDKIPQINMGVENVILSNYASAFGYQNIAGMKAFPILRYEPDFDNNTARIGIFVGKHGDIQVLTASIEQLNNLVGEKYSSRMDGNWLNSGVISSVDDKTLDVINGEYVMYVNVTGIEPEDSIEPIISDTVTSETGYYLFFVDKPEAGNISIGSYSMARGYQTWAGFWAFAEGYYTRAMGRYSHAEGTDTFTWYAAHAEGQRTRAFGHNSHSEGYGTISSGNAAHAEGRNGLAYNEGSHKEGLSSKRLCINGYYYEDDVDNNSEIIHIERETFSDSEMLLDLWKNGISRFALACGRGSHVEGLDNIAFGDYSHAEGNSVLAIGINSHAEGALFKDDATGVIKYNIASGNTAHTEGQGTQATNHATHAEGRGSIASGQISHAEGLNTSATAIASHSEGVDTVASGTYSHAEGEGSEATATAAHAEGKSTADGNYSHAEGGGTASAEYAHAEGHGLVENGEGAHAEGSGTVTAGISAHAEGGGTVSADYAHAEGSGTVRASYAHAEGSGTVVSGVAAHAEGQGTSAQGAASHAEGTLYDDTSTTASGTASHAEGQGTLAEGISSHAEGRLTEALGDLSHVEGDKTKAHSASSHAEGVQSEATGQGAHAEGYKSKTYKIGAHAEGANTAVYGKYGHAEGQNAQVGVANNGENDSLGAHAEGYYTQAIGNYSHAEGSNTISNNTGAHVEGLNNFTTIDYQHVQGKYNANPGPNSNNKQPIHIVGWGTNSTNGRKNVHVLYEDGNAFYSGTLESPTIRRIDSAANNLNNKVDALIETHNTHVNKISTLISQNNEDISKLKSSLTRFDRFAEFSEGLKYGGAFDELPTITVESGAIKISGTLTTLQGSVDTDVNDTDTESLDDDDVKITNTVTATKVLPNEIIPVVNPGLVIVVKGTEYVLEIKPSNDAEIKVDNLEFIPLMNINDAFYNVEDEIDRYHPMELKSASHSGSGIVLVGTPDVVVESTITVNKKCQHTTTGAGFDLSGLNIDSHSEGYEKIIIDDLQTKESEIEESGPNFVKIQEILSTTTNTTTYKTKTIFHSSSVTGIFQNSLYGGSEYSAEPSSISCFTKQVTIALKDRPGNIATTKMSVTAVYPIYAGIFKPSQIRNYATFDDDGLGNMYTQTSLNIGKITLSGQITSSDYANNIGEATYFYYGIPKNILNDKDTVSIEWIAGMSEEIDVQTTPYKYEVKIANVPYLFVRSEQVITNKTKTVQSVIVSS